MGGHDKADDSVDFDQTPDSGGVEGHDWVEHEDGSADGDEG